MAGSNDMPAALAHFLVSELGDAPAGTPTRWLVTGPLWLWRGTHADGTPTKAAWIFLTISGVVADAIRAGGSPRGGRRGFSATRVTATIGGTSWATSLFPHRDSGGFLLPVKAMVRKAEGVKVGDVVSVEIRLGG
jgi:hypothetical protein